MPWHWTPTQHTLFGKYPLPHSRAYAACPCAAALRHLPPLFSPSRHSSVPLQSCSRSLWRGHFLFMQSMHQRMCETSIHKPPLLAHLQSLTSGIDYR